MGDAHGGTLRRRAGSLRRRDGARSARTPATRAALGRGADRAPEARSPRPDRRRGRRARAPCPVRRVSRCARPATSHRTGGARDPRALQPPARGLGARNRRTRHRDRDPDRVGEDPLLQPACHRRRAQDRREGPLPLPDQGAVAGPGERDPGAQRGRPARRSRLHLRRRHARRRAPRGADARRHRGLESRHAPPGDPAASHQVGAVLRGAPLCGDRRAAHLPRRVRFARLEPHPAAAADLPVLRGGPGLHRLLGDDREPGRAGGTAARRPGARGHRVRRTAGPEALPGLEPAGAERRSRHPRVRAVAVDADRAAGR